MGHKKASTYTIVLLLLAAQMRQWPEQSAVDLYHYPMDSAEPRCFPDLLFDFEKLQKTCPMEGKRGKCSTVVKPI